jgi:hypothetical protein
MIEILITINFISLNKLFIFKLYFDLPLTLNVTKYIKKIVNEI